MGWVKYSTVGAKAGDNIKDESGNVLDNEDIRNDDLTVAYSGTNIQLKKAGSQIGSNVDSPSALKNAQITTNANGTLNNAGSGTAPSLASIAGVVAKAGGGFGESMASATGAVSFSSGTLSTGTLPASIGGTGATNTNALQNSRVKMTVDGTLDYNNANEAAPSLASITGIVGKAGGGFGTSMASSTGIVRFASGTLNTDAALSTTYTDATDNGTTINTSGNITGDLSLTSTLTLGTSSGNKIVCGNITIDGENGRIVITD